MAIAIISTIIFFIVLGVGSFFAFKKIKETDPRNTDSSISHSADTAQDFLPFKDIKDRMIDIGNSQYRVVVECTSTNYNLKTEREKEVIEASFQRFVNSLNHPIWFYIQTRVIDNTKLLKQMQIEVDATVLAAPILKTYADEYMKSMKNLNTVIDNDKQKKKYVIVPYDDAMDMVKLDADEQYEFAKSEAMQRAFIIANGLASVGVKCKILNDAELIELVYSSYHKDNFSDSEFLASGDFTQLIVSGDNIQQRMSKDQALDHILYEAQVRISNEVAGRAETPELKKDYEDVIRRLNQLRDETGAYYKR